MSYCEGCANLQMELNSTRTCKDRLQRELDMSLKTNGGYASAVEECKRLQRELGIAGLNYEALTKESLNTQERLQRELKEARTENQRWMDLCTQKSQEIERVTLYRNALRVEKDKQIATLTQERDAARLLLDASAVEECKRLRRELEESERKGLVLVKMSVNLQRELEEARAELQNRGGVLFKIVEVLIAAGIDMNGSTILKGIAALRERAEGLERERQHAVDALQRCDEDREVLLERAERAEADTRIIEEENNGFREKIATLTQEREEALRIIAAAHSVTSRLLSEPLEEGSSGLVEICTLLEGDVFPADPKKADRK